MNKELFDQISSKLFDTILNNVLEVQCPAALLICLLAKTNSKLAVENTALITALIQTSFNNMHQRLYVGTNGYLFTAANNIYANVKEDDDLVKQFTNVYLSQSLTVLQSAILARCANMPVLLVHQGRVMEVVQLCCLCQSAQMKLQSDILRQAALQIVMNLIFATLHTFSQQNQVETKQIAFEDFKFSIPTQADNQKCV